MTGHVNDTSVLPVLTEAQKASVLKEQLAGWERAKEAGRKGNPFATLCLHCYGRHAPPNDEICPFDPPSKDTR